jgi:Ca2+-binding EF-hand superfamily protein
MVLTQEEIDGCRDAFLAFDKDRSGTIDVWELRQVLEAMGQKPTEEELFQMISEVDDNMSGSIDFAEFLKVLQTRNLNSLLSHSICPVVASTLHSSSTVHRYSLSRLQVT